MKVWNGKISCNYGITLFVIVFTVFSSCRSIKPPDEIKASVGLPPAIIPLPASVLWGDEIYRIPEINIICYNEGSKAAASWLEELLKSVNVQVQEKSEEACGNWKLITDSELSERLGDEGYILDISTEEVTIKSATEAGLFYGIQTLRQMFPAKIEEGGLGNIPVFLRKVYIEDRPEYSWRGTMVDIARSFFGPEYLKQHLDRMALYKLNRLHLHLTDDQGWRIEIKGLPRLTEIGSSGAVENGRSGYLTRDEYLDLQKYALARNIIIIPEIDLPGHIYAALASYPNLNCPGLSNLTPVRAIPPEMFSGHEVGWSKLCLEDPEVYDFVGEVLGEIAEITRGPWIHIGGDEIDDPLYEEFIVKADSIVRANGKITIGWEEVTKANVSSGLISQQWHGNVKAAVDVKKIHSLCSQFYLDHANIPGQENTNNWCKKSGVSLEDVYSFKTTDPDVIGVEAPVWTEHVHSEESLDNRFWPRILAVAEAGWTSQQLREFSNFKVRLSEQSSRLNSLGINYFKTPGIDWKEPENAAKAGSVFSGFMPEQN